MKYTSILEKMQCLLELIRSSIVYMAFLSIIVTLLGLFLMKKMKKKKFIVMMLILYLSLFAFVIFNNFENLNNTFDSIMTNLFKNIYFPSAYAYLFILMVIDISMVISLLKIKMEKIYKIVNSVVYSMIQFLLVMIMDLISKNNIDIFSESSLFTNHKLVMMLELSMNIFIVWLVVLAGIFLVNNITAKILAGVTEKQLEEAPISLDAPNLEVNINDNQLANDYLYDNNPVNLDTKSLELENTVLENTSVQDCFNLNDLVQQSMDKTISEESILPIENTPMKEDENLKKEASVSGGSMFDMILNNSLPVIQGNSLPEIEKDVTNYTLSDYKIFNKMLKEIKMYNIGSIVNIDKSLELRLLDKFSKDEYNLFKKMLKSYSN